MSHASQTAATVPFSGEPFTPLPARQWQGETDVVVGPFSSKKWANYFADVVLEKDPTGATACYIFHRMDEWFVDICKQTDEAPVTVPTPTSAGPDGPG